MDQKDQKVRIFFSGSGAFAVPVLQGLLQSDKVEVLGIITQPDKPAGRKKILTPSPVGIWCAENKIACEKVRSVNDPEFLARIRREKPDMMIVVSFGQLLKEEILALPEICCMNVHASILPQYRGASPIISVILAGEKETGVTFMKMDRGLDTGDMLETWRFPIPEEMKADELEQQLALLAAQHLPECIRKTAQNLIPAIPQDHSRATFTHKIRKQDGSLCWHDPAEQTLRKVRAFQPWPSVVFTVQSTGGKMMTVKITDAVKAADEDTGKEPGTILGPDPSGIRVVCGKGTILIRRVIPEGKREMSAADFARGCRFGAGDKFLDGPK